MQSTPVLTMTEVATAAIVGNVFVGMFTGATCAAGAIAQGVSRFPVASGESLAIDVIGTTKVLSGAAITKGAAVKADAAGKAIPQGGTGVIVGYAREAATAADQLIEVLLVIS